jgi:MFS family permease
MFLGFSIVTMLTTANGYVQTTTEPALRGRVLALYMAVLMGGMPFGAPIVGAVVDAFGPRVGILVGAGAGVVAFSIGLVWLLSSGRVHRHEARRFRLTIDETRPLSVVRPTPEEFSEPIAQTTPIPLTDGRAAPRRGRAVSRPEPAPRRPARPARPHAD